ncbi:hypothetical protein N9N17_02995 [Schleiferiaceae bacterium]|nr:hypothetical protein [Schleiferiaceae bacterium]
MKRALIFIGYFALILMLLGAGGAGYLFYNQDKIIAGGVAKLNERLKAPVAVSTIELDALDEKIVVKIPMIKDGVKALKYFSDKGIKTNCTLIFSAGQALMAAKAGATYVSPFIGRLDDISTDGLDLIESIRIIFDNYDFGTEILAASVRHPMHIIQCAEIGADVMTGPLSAMEALLKHPLTDIGLAKFLADHAKANS